MIIRIGYAPAAAPPDPDGLAALAVGLEREGFDSLWVTEKVTGPAGDPNAVLAYAAALTSRIKFGHAVMTLPGRRPALVAAELATLDVLSRGRLLPAFGLGQRDAAEHQAFGVRREERAAIFEEALPLLRRFWSGERVTHRGEHFAYEDLRVRPTPVKGAFDVWMGGASDVELRRTGRLADGWLAAFTTPAEGEQGRLLVQRAAAEVGREIEEEHFGAVVPYRRGPLPERAEAHFARARRVRGQASVDNVIPDVSALEAQLKRFVEAGLSKFVLAPIVPPADWDAELADLRDAVLHLQTRR